MADRTAPTTENLVLGSCEPSPDSSLLQHAQIRILFISNIPIPVGAAVSGTTRTFGNQIQQHLQQNSNAARGLGVEVSADTEGGPLRGRVLSLMRERLVVTHEEVKNAFPAASEYYSPSTKLFVNVEEASSESPSVWENMLMYKRLGAVVTVVNGACATARQQLAAVKAMFQQKAYASVVGRCYVIEGSDELMASVDRNVFKQVSIAAKPLKDHVNDIVLALTCEIVHYFTHRVNSLQTAASHQQVTTPLDRASSSTSSGKLIEGKVLAGRAAKQQGDVLLQLGATSAALQAYSKAVGLDTVWTAATLEAFAAARYLDNSRFFANAVALNKQLLSLCAGKNRENAHKDLSLLEELMNLVGTRLELAVRLGPLPSTTRQRLVSEVESVTLKKILDIKPKISFVKELLSQLGGSNAEEEDTSDSLRSALIEVQSLYTAIVKLSYAELELYLSEAYYMYPSKGTRPSSSSSSSLGAGSLVGLGGGSKSMTGMMGSDSVRLLGLEIELLLKLAKLRAEQKNARGLLECIGTLHGTLPYLGCYSTRRELLISRKLPDLCYECGCFRKAVYYLQQSAANDRENSRIYESLQSLLKACEWCAIPIGFDAPRGGLKLKHDFTISSSNAATSRNDAMLLTNAAGSSADVAIPSSSSSSSVRIQVSLLLELLATLRSVQDLDETQWGLACHVAALLIFKFYDYIDDVGQSKLNFVLQTCSVTLPLHLRPTIVSPPLVRSVTPLPLPSHLCPQNEHVGGVKFIRFNTKTALFSFQGEIMKTNLVWVAGECAQVQVHIVNPFRNEVQLSSVAVRCRAKNGAPNAATTYVTHGALVKPQGTDIIVVNVLPLIGGGILLIDGVEVRIGQSGFRNPIMITIPPIEVPVMNPMPLIACGFNVEEVEVFAQQVYFLTILLHNIGSLRIDAMTFTLHRSDCNLQGCEGCIEKANPNAVTAAVDRAPLLAAVPLGAGGSIALKVTLTPPVIVREIREEYIIARVEYGQDFAPPPPPRDVPDATTPTYAPIPRRVHDAKLRVFLLPGVEVVSVTLSADRRYIVAQVQCLSSVTAIVLVANDRVPFERQANVTILPRQSASLRFVIARIPREHRRFSLNWHVQDRPDVCGTLPMDFTAELEHVRCTEPLEDIVVCGALLDDHHYANNAHLYSSAVAVPHGRASSVADGHAVLEGQMTHIMPIPQQGVAGSNANPEEGESPTNGPIVYRAPAAAADALSHFEGYLPSWASYHPNTALPYAVSAVQPVRFRLVVAVPWLTVVPLYISLSFDDGGVIAGPTLTRWMLGAGCEAFDEEMEMYLFTTGEHTLRIAVRDEEGREIRFSWMFVAEHENASACPAGAEAASVAGATEEELTDCAFGERGGDTCNQLENAIKNPLPFDSQRERGSAAIARGGGQLLNAKGSSNNGTGKMEAPSPVLGPEPEANEAMRPMMGLSV